MTLKLTIAGKAPLVAFPSLIAAEIVNSNSTDQHIDVEFVDEKSCDPSKDAEAKLTSSEGTIETQVGILNFLGEIFPQKLGAHGTSQEWLKFAFEKLSIKNFKELAGELEKLDLYLNLRSFIVGYSLTLSDIAVWGVLRANALMGSIIKNEVYANISRWYNFLLADPIFKKSVEKFSKSIFEVRKSSKGGKKESHKANFEIELPNAEIGKVVTRFPPEPSGYLHVGHFKAAILNEYFAHAYKGKLIIRFDDTNPSKEKMEFEDSILADLSILGIKGDRVTYSSNYFGDMYSLAMKLIKEGKAYCDDTDLEKMREQRMVGDPSERRERSVEENLNVFTQEMFNATPEGLKNCLRAKIDYKALNKALRDPVIYRCNLTPHHKTGNAWKIYPTYDFCAPVVDSIEGVTHALRTNEYRDRNEQYEWILKSLGLRHVDIWDFSRINFVRTLLSKRKLQWFVDNNYVSDWTDPRFPTVRGIMRRGMTVEGLRKFIISQGPSKNIINLDWSSIWALNKKVIDPVAPRFTCILATNPVKVKLLNGPETPIVEEKPKHKKNPDVGMKPVIFANAVLIDQEDAETLNEGEEVTFMDWGNVIISKIVKEGTVVKQVEANLHLEGDFRKTSKKLTWLADTNAKVELELHDFDHLITKDKIEEDDDFKDYLTPQTEFRTKAIGDLNVRHLKVGEIIQFERKGYFRVDRAFGEQTPSLFAIPDGKVVSRYGAKK